MDDVTTLYDIAVSSYSLCLGHLYDLCKFCLLYKALLTRGYEYIIHNKKYLENLYEGTFVCSHIIFRRKPA